MDGTTVRLPDDEVHIWIINDERLPSIVDVAQLSQVLTTEEWARHARFFFDKDKHQFLVTRAMVREVLSRYRPEIAPVSWRFENNAHGKPRIATEQCTGNLYFNLAHTSGLIVLALRSDPDIGIDVECFNRPMKEVTLYRSVLTTHELRTLQLLPLPMQSRRFYELWTLKEAYVKAVGQGLSIPPRSFGFELTASANPILYLCGHLEPKLDLWRFRRAIIQQRYCMALAFTAFDNRAEDDRVLIFEYPDGRRHQEMIF